MGQHLQPSEFIALTPTTPRTTWPPALSYGSGTASSCLSMPQRGYSLTPLTPEKQEDLYPDYDWMNNACKTN